MASNRFSQTDPAILAPYTNAIEVEPNDDEDLAEVTRGLMGHDPQHGQNDWSHITVIMENGSTPIMLHFVNGSILPIRVRRVMETGTDADQVIALY